jgi:hypothetical protein
MLKMTLKTLILQWAAAGAWHGHPEDDLDATQVGQEHPEDHPVHEDGVCCQVHQGRT